MKLKKMSADHRRAERFSLQLPAKIQPILEGKPDEALDFITSNVCSGGAYFHTDHPLPLGTEVNIEMVLPLDKLTKIKGKQIHIRVSGAVIRATEKGMAIYFDNNCVFSPLPENTK